MLFSLMFSNVQKETYDIKPFQIAPSTIRSLKTVEDTVKTEQDRDRAAIEVTPYYEYSEEVAKNRQAIAASLFDFLLELKKAQMVMENSSEEQPVKVNEIPAIKEKIKALEEEEPALQLSDATIQKLVQLSESELKTVQKTIVALLEEQLSFPIHEQQVVNFQNTIEQKIRQSKGIPEAVLSEVITIGRALIVETEMVNEELTASKIQETREAVEPTRILQGQVIVREGQVVDSELYRQLELAGLLTDQSSLKPVIGLVLFVLFVATLFYLHFATWKEEETVKKKSLLITLTIYFMLVVLMKILSLIEKDFDVLVAFLFPTALAPMLIRLLTNERLAFMMTVLTAATAGIMLQEGYASIMQMEVSIYILFGGIVSLYLIGSSGRRSSILRTSVAVSISNLLFIAFYLLMTQSTYAMAELAFYVAAAITSGILSGALTIGLMPFFESVFGLLSDMRLIELSNPNHPLLKKVLTETPGTYHHSVMVANLADAACESIGANGLLARVGSYYHDIGKTVRPGYFIENQHYGQNPHDGLPPSKSGEIIISHTEDGARMLEKHKMPKEIIDIARQHHGTSLLKFFYVKAKELDEQVDEMKYRYPGPKPQTKEIAIISIADSAEAATRSMKEPTPQKISALVKAIIEDKLKDGQFNECDLSMKELKKVEHVICETLNGTFHNRIEYPDLKE